MEDTRMPDGNAVRNYPILKQLLVSYGGQKTQAEVAVPEDEEQLVAALQDARRDGLKVTFRSGGRSFDTQALNDVRVISLEKFANIGRVDCAAKQITVGAGAAWSDILKVTIEHGFVPFVMVTSSGATAGGTLASDCLSRFSPSCGKEGVHVASFRFVPMDGPAITCSRADDVRDVFRAAISGLGYVGVITEITYNLLELPWRDVAVESTIEPFEGLKSLAGMLVEGVRQAHWGLCGKESLRIGEAEAGAASARQCINATREQPAQARAVYAALYMNEKRRGLLVHSRYVSIREAEARARGERLQGTVIHKPRSLGHILLQLVALFRWTRPIGWWIVTTLVFSHRQTFLDELFGFTFFQDGNETVKRFGRRLGLPMGTRQQTYVVPWDPTDAPGSSAMLAKFLDEADKILDKRGLLPTLIDVLYVPDDADEGFFLSSSAGISGFAVSIAFEKIFSSKLPDEEAALREIAHACHEATGRVHLVKHVYADPKIIKTMYRDGIESLIGVKRVHDSKCILRNEFLERVFPDVVERVLH
jgi:decaprenylphospho-beta-D-ribofuranose 2-oxidase